MGRPPSNRITGSGDKLRLWFEITNRPLSYATKDSKKLDPEKAQKLPSLKALKEWITRGIPASEINPLAGALDVPPRYFYPDESLENFRTFIAGQADASTLLPKRVTLAGGQIMKRLAVLVEHNSNTKRALAAIIHAPDPRASDEIADRINVSTIQLREILQELMVIGVIEVADDIDLFPTNSPARIRLTASARENKIVIESLVNGSRH